MKDAFNQQLGWLDNTLQPQTEDSWFNYQNAQQDNGSRIAGLYDPSGIQQANEGFDNGVNQYEQRASDMYNNAGYSPEEVQGMRQATQAGIQGATAQADNQVKLQQQRTGNSAGVNGALQGLARQKGQMLSAGLGGLEQGIGDKRVEGQQAALTASQFPQMARLQRMQGERDTVGLGQTQATQGLQGYNTGVSGQLGAVGQRSGNIASNPSFMKQLGSGLASGIAGGLTSFIGG